MRLKITIGRRGIAEDESPADACLPLSRSGVPLIGITLLHRKGYFHQHLDETSPQTESPVEWHPEEKLELMKPVVTVPIEGRDVKVRAWRYTLEGVGSDVVSVYLLDTMVDGNTPEDQRLTDYLYGGDNYYRLCQENARSRPGPSSQGASRRGFDHGFFFVACAIKCFTRTFGNVRVGVIA